MRSIALYDIDPERLAHLRDRGPAQSPDAQGAGRRSRRRPTARAALDGADYAITMIQVGGYRPCTVTDFEMPKKYGLRQTIADTLGIGGIMRGAAHHPGAAGAWRRDMERLCPDVTFLQYANPMAMNCWALNRATKIKTVGLCHSVQGTAERARRGHRRAGRGDQLSLRRHQPHGLLPEVRAQRRRPVSALIRKVVAEGRVPEWNRVRYEMFLRLGYFVTESSEHFSEYVPWFIKRGPSQT